MIKTFGGAGVVMSLALSFLLPIDLEAQETTARAAKLDSLRLRIEEVSRLQMEEVRRITEARRAELEALREALEAESGRMREAQRALQEAERALANARMNEVATSTSGRPVTDANSNAGINMLRSATSSTGNTTRFFTFQNQIPGAALISLNPDLAGYFEVEKGVLVTEITDGTPAAQAGLRPGDVIVAVGESPVSSTEEIVSAIRSLQSEQMQVFTTTDEAMDALRAGVQLRSEASAEDGGAPAMAPTGNEAFRVFNQLRVEGVGTLRFITPGRLSAPLPLRVVRKGNSLEITLEP